MGYMNQHDVIALLRRIPIARLDAEDGKGFTCLGCGATEQQACLPNCWCDAVETAINTYEDYEPLARPGTIEWELEQAKRAQLYKGFRS
jgi:hypothetical protein